MMKSPLTPAQETLLKAERDLLVQLRDLIGSTSPEDKVVGQLDDLIAHLGELFLVVIVGEFNAGKSTVVNALFGEKIMEEGPIPTTAKITILRYGEARLDRPLSAFVTERRYPSELLKRINLVDTPGTNSVIRRHQEITEDFLPRADLVLFVTSYDRPLTESERQFLEYIRTAWRKRLVFVLNKVDLARSEALLKQVLEHIRSNCLELMQFEPHLIPVSAEQAFEARTTAAEGARADLWEKSGFEVLETFITETLTDQDRLLQKFITPLDVADSVIAAHSPRLVQQRAVLHDDARRLAQIDEHIAQGRDGLGKAVGRNLKKLDGLLTQVEGKGEQFLDDNIRVGKVRMLRDKERFRETFAQQVFQNTEQQVERLISEMIDEVLGQSAAVWRKVVQRLAEHRPDAAALGAFDYNRSAVFHSVMREAERNMELHSLGTEARRIQGNVRDAAEVGLGTAIVGGGLGIIAVLVIVGTTLDILGGVGLFSAMLMLGAGALILPRQRRKAIEEFKTGMAHLRNELHRALTGEFDAETTSFIDKVNGIIRPYQTFVHDAQAHLDRAEAAMDDVRKGLADLRKRVGSGQSG